MTAGYTGDDLRAWKTNASGTTYYLYDGDEIACELDSSDNVTASNTVGADGLISRRIGSTSTFYTFDPQGSCVQRLDSSGSIIDSTICDAFGNRVSTDSSTDPYSGFGAESGYYSDSETGLQLLTARYYDPQTGRFINRDPSGASGGLNLYAYTSNSPLSASDPTGLMPTAQSGCKEAGNVNMAIKLACDQITKCPTSHDKICPTPDEKTCLERLCKSSMVIKCGSRACGQNYRDYISGKTTQLTGAYTRCPWPFGGSGNGGECFITMCTRVAGDTSRGFAAGTGTNIQQMAYLIIHEMFHCCGRGDNGGPMLSTSIVSSGSGTTVTFSGGSPAVTNPADDGTRCCMGLHVPYLGGYGTMSGYGNLTTD